MLELYDYFRSSASFRVRIALNLKNLTYKKIPIHLLNNGGEQFSENYTKINFQHLVPTLNENHKLLTQSLAIIEYLEETHPLPPLLPEDPFGKALVRAFALTITSDIHPINNLRVLKYLTSTFQISEDEKNQWYQHWIHQGFSALEKTVIAYGKAKKFCFGDNPTLADICLVPQMYNARRFNCDLDFYPSLTKIEENCRQLPAFIDAAPSDENVATTKG